MSSLMLMLLGWLNLHTDFDTQVELPNIVITEHANLCAQYGIHDKGTCEATRLVAFYDRKRTIYLHPNFDPADETDRSVLLHELVHYLQWQNGLNENACWGDLEVQAYRLQDDWRWQNDIPGQTDPFKMVMLEAACES